MAVISCPNCQGKLKFPDGMPPRRVKCPGCAHGFMAGPNGPVKGGVTGGSSAVLPKMPGSDSTSAIKKKPPAQKVEDLPEDDVEVVDDEDDRPRTKRRRDEDEDDDRPRSKRRNLDDQDDNRPQRKRRDEDEEDDDRPRSRRRDEDDEDDDRPRRKRRDEDDDDDYDRRPKDTTKILKAQMGRARTGMMLIGIGFWCQVGALSITLFSWFLALVAGEYVPELNIPAGLAGLVNWICAAVGIGFLISGPRKGNLLGLTIALAAVAAIHLFFVIYIGFGSDRYIAYGIRSHSSVNWSEMNTQLHGLLMMITTDVFVTAVLFAALFEVARYILFTLVVKEYGRLVKKRDVTASAQLLLVGMPSLLGICFVLFFILRLIAKNSSIGSEGRYIAFVMMLLEFGGFITLYVMSALLCGKAKNSLYVRK